MKIINTNRGNLKGFFKKNGAYFVLALVIVASCVTVYIGGMNKPQNEPIANLSSKEESNWNTSSKKPITPANTQPSSQVSSAQSSSQQSQSKPQNVSSSSQKPQSSVESQKILYISPVNGEILNKFSGDKPVKSKTMGDWRLHTGIDIACDKGTSVKASGKGTVKNVYTDDMWGTTVEISHEDGRTTIYSSLSDKTFVKKGDSVESGQMIGTVENSAQIELSEEMHLHFAVKNGDKYEDPQKVITYPINSSSALS